MPQSAVSQLLLLTAEALVVCGLLLWFFRLRKHFGHALLYVSLGAFQHLQSLMATTLYLEIAPGIVVSPGSTILFTATLFAVLLVYVREDAAQTRSLIVGIVAANLTLSLIFVLAALHLDSELLVATGYSNDYLLQWSTRAFVIGTATLVIDVVLIIILYEFFFRIFPRFLFARILAAMLVVVNVDTGLFVTANFYGEPGFGPILKSAMIGKSATAVLYSVLLTGYLLLTRREASSGKHAEEPIHDIFHILTYKQRFEILEDEMKRDSLSGLFNRGFFDENLRRELERAARLQHSLNLVFVDIDHFKSINDTHGHQVGDKAIVALADSMRRAFRSADIPCRYGGEEFAVIMPDSSVEAAYRATQRLQEEYTTTCGSRNLVEGAITFTAGIANYPSDGATPDELLRVADQRLYKGKDRGRNRVMIDTVIMRALKPN